jgi:hypothetical protein
MRDDRTKELRRSLTLYRGYLGQGVSEGRAQFYRKKIAMPENELKALEAEAAAAVQLKGEGTLSADSSD